MSYRVHVRGPSYLRRPVASPLFLAVLLLSPAAFAQEAGDAPEPTEAEATPSASRNEAVAAEADDAAEDTAKDAPDASAAEGGVAETPEEGANERPVFLVMDVVVGEDVNISAEAARDALAGRFGRLRGKLEVRSLGEVKATLDQQALNQLLGGAGEGLEQLDRYVDADRVVYGRIHKVGDVTEVSVRVFNVREGVMEMAMSRRLLAGANDALVLSVVDALADRLTVWALNTYGDAAPSSKFAELQNKKVNKRGAADVAAPAPASPWTFLGVGGSALAGVGLGTVGIGAAMVSVDPEPDTVLTSVVMGAGAAAFLGGMTMVIIDGIE